MANASLFLNDQIKKHQAANYSIGYLGFHRHSNTAYKCTNQANAHIFN